MCSVFSCATIILKKFLIIKKTRGIRLLAGWWDDGVIQHARQPGDGVLR